MTVKTEKQNIGNVGEDIAARFLMRHGYHIIDRNYWKTFGEIDIVCRKDGKVHFIEVKTVSRETVSRETIDEHRAEDNMHPAKLRMVGKAIETYLLEKDIKEEWGFHGIVVRLDSVRKIARVRLLQNLIIEQFA